MNKQGEKGIEWTHVFGPETGYTWNPIGGCLHGCQWNMPNGQVANCYAEDVAKKLQSDTFYPQGFENHYWNPTRLSEPAKKKEPCGIFMDSMSDFFGSWVPEDQQDAACEVVGHCPHHIFMSLTKAAPNMLAFYNRHSEPKKNWWFGASSPPDIMFEKLLGLNQQQAMLRRTLNVFDKMPKASVRWLSMEPLSWDMGEVLEEWSLINDYLPIEWAVIGAASNGKKYYQPDPKHVERVLKVLDFLSIPVFFKGNLEWEPFRKEFPRNAE